MALVAAPVSQPSFAPQESAASPLLADADKLCFAFSLLERPVAGAPTASGTYTFGIAIGAGDGDVDG